MLAYFIFSDKPTKLVFSSPCPPLEMSRLALEEVRKLVDIHPSPLW